MIDTVVLILSADMYSITDPYRFISAAHWALQSSYAPGMQSKQNPTTKELKDGIYKPRLMLSSRVNISGLRDVVLKIELSLPKLLLGNNFAELQYKDFAKVMTMLHDTLQAMGVAVSAQALMQAPVAAIHYAKNIALTDGSTPYHYIQKIKDAELSLSLDVNQTDYRNAGHSYKWHCNAYEVVFYDKIKDLEKARASDKRALEKDNTVQLHLLDVFKKRTSKLEFLRMEVRLNKRQKLKQLFKKLNIKTDLTLKKLFKPAIAQKVLLYYLDALERKRPLLIDYKAANAKALLVDLVVNNPMLGPKQILQLYGLRCALDTMTPRELKSIFFKCSARSWQRLMTDAHQAALPALSSPFKDLKKAIMQWKPIKAKDIAKIQFL